MAQIVTPPLFIVWPQWVGGPCGSRGESAHGSPVGHDFCPLLLVKVLPIHHPLFLTDKLKRVLLETLLCKVSWAVVGHFAKAIGVSASVVCTHVPFHLLERTEKPLRDWSLAGPLVFLGIFPQTEPIAVAAATVPKLSTAVPFASLKIFFCLKTELVLGLLVTWGHPPKVPQGLATGAVPGAFQGNFFSWSWCPACVKHIVIKISDPFLGPQLTRD